MITFDVFNNDAFSVTSMIRSIDKKPYKPTGLDALLGFEPVPVSTDTVFVEFKQGQLNLIRTTLRGAPIEMGKPDTKNIRPFRLPRLAKGDQIFAHQLANLRPYDGEGDVETVARMLDRMQNQLIDDLEYTEEYHRLGALFGIVYEPDGTTEIFNFWTEFGVSPPSAIDLDLDNASPSPGKLRRDINSLIVRPIARASQAGNNPRFRVRALCGDAFFDRLTTHPDVEKTYLNWAAAEALRNNSIWEPFPFGGVDWINYRGADDGTTLSVPTNEARVFPTGVPGMFQHVMGPNNEQFETMNQMGRRYYPLVVRDKDRDQWVQPEIYAYPGFLNTRPDLILKAQI